METISHIGPKGQAGQKKGRKEQMPSPKRTDFFQSDYVRYLNLQIILPVAILLMIGIVMVFSASSYLSMKESGGATSTAYAFKQCLFIVVSLVVMGVIYPLKTTLYRSQRFKKGLELLVTLLMAYVLVAGEVVNGAKGWINLGPISVQPVEFMKLAMVLLWADYLTAHQADIQSLGFWRTIKKDKFLPILTVVWLAMVAALPDMGGLLLLVAILAVMIFASGISPAYLLIAAGGLLAAYGIFLLAFNLFDMSFLNKISYVFKRFTSFVDPFADSQGNGLQLVNSYYALALGRLTGQGAGNSIQKTGYLPEAHNDFIIAIVGEEFGLLMIILILLLYFYLVFYLYYKSQKMGSAYHQLVLIGIGSYFLAQAVVNLGGLTGLLPITGVTFPFISYGGSSMLVTLMMVGLALGVIRSDRKNYESYRRYRQRKEARKQALRPEARPSH